MKECGCPAGTTGCGGMVEVTPGTPRFKQLRAHKIPMKRGLGGVLPGWWVSSCQIRKLDVMDAVVRGPER